MSKLATLATKFKTRLIDYEGELAIVGFNYAKQLAWEVKEWDDKRFVLYIQCQNNPRALAKLVAHLARFGLRTLSPRLDVNADGAPLLLDPTSNEQVAEVLDLFEIVLKPKSVVHGYYEDY